MISGWSQKILAIEQFLLWETTNIIGWYTYIPIGNTHTSTTYLVRYLPNMYCTDDLAAWSVTLAYTEIRNYNK